MPTVAQARMATEQAATRSAPRRGTRSCKLWPGESADGTMTSTPTPMGWSTLARSVFASPSCADQLQVPFTFGTPDKLPSHRAYGNGQVRSRRLLLLRTAYLSLPTAVGYADLHDRHALLRPLFRQQLQVFLWLSPHHIQLAPRAPHG